MESIGLSEFKRHFSNVLERVLKGETIEVTKRGVPIAHLQPILDSFAESREAAQLIRVERKGVTLKGLKVRDLIEHGRRY